MKPPNLLILFKGLGFAPRVFTACCLYLTKVSSMKPIFPNAEATIAIHQSCIIASFGIGSASLARDGLNIAVQPVTKLLVSKPEKFPFESSKP